MDTRKLYYLLRGTMGLSFFMMFTAAALYRIDIAQLEVYQLILIGTALEIAVFVFEVPTGIIADLKSRRLSVIIGLFIIGLGFITEALTPYFIVIFIAQIVWGLGYTFISGALDSWVSDELENEGIEHVIITGGQFNKIFQVVGILLAAVIGMYSLQLAIYIAGGIFIMAGLIGIFFMKEDHFTKHVHETPLYKQYFNQLGSAFQHVRKHKVLKVMFVIMLFYGLYSEGIDRTYELHILDNLGLRWLFDLPGIWILSIINAFVALSGFLLLYVVKRYSEKGRYIVVWAFNFTILMAVGVLIFGFFEMKYVAVFGFILFSVAREGTYPLLDTILVKNTPSNIKATVLSGFGQLDAIGQLLSGGIMVLMSVYFGIQGVYLLTAILLIVPIILFTRIKE